MVKPASVDVPLLSEADFDNPNIDAQYLIADISLYNILNGIASAMDSAPSFYDRGSLTHSLGVWMSQLPASLALFDAHGSRMPYRFPSTDLFITYYSTVILSQNLIRHTGMQTERSHSTISVLAAVHVAMLYEEILYRDDLALLCSIHAFWCLTAALPLLSFRPTRPDLEAQRKDSLEVLCSILDQLRPRFGLATTAADKIERLRHTRDYVVVSQRNTTSPSTYHGFGTEQSSPVTALFPALSAAPNQSERAPVNAFLQGILETECPNVDQATEFSVDGFDGQGASTFFDSLFDFNFLGNAMGDASW
jgi:hypothetical protein